MKKTIFAMAALFLTIGHVLAQTPLSVENATIPQNGEGELVVNFQFDTEGVYTAYTFDLDLPEGISFATNSGGKYIYTKGDCHSDSHSFTLGYNTDRKAWAVGCLSVSSDPLAGTSGMLMSITVKTDDTYAPGTELRGTMKMINFSTVLGQSVDFEDVPFTITIGEPDDGRIKFNEAASELPEYEAGATGNVTMTRTIKADQWSTIVLPFNLTKAKAEKAFGDDVRFAKFDGFVVDYGADEDNVTPLGITINFNSYTIPPRGNLPGGTPVLIKVSKEISEPMKFDEVTLTAGVEDQNVKDQYKTKGKFTGSLVKTVVPEDGLFIADNEFWYSVGKTNIKAFRGWFELGAVLGQETTDFGAKVTYMIDGDATRIEGLSRDGMEDGAVYTLGGQLVGKDVRIDQLPKGVYIINGKKRVVK